MKIADIFTNFTNNIFLLRNHETELVRSSGMEFDNLEQVENEIGLDSTDMFNCMGYCFHMVDSGELYHYGYKEFTVRDRFKNTAIRQNRRHQWLLAEAYELFEDFLTAAYACFGLEDKNNWPLRDFGELHLDQLENLTFEAMLSKAKDKKDIPRSLLNYFNSRFPGIESFCHNRLGVDLLFSVCFIEKLRHHIVHTKGYISDKEKFTEGLLKRLGQNNNGKIRTKYLNTIDLYIRPADKNYFIQLGGYSPFASSIVFTAAFEQLVDCLLSYAHIITKSIQTNSVKGATGSYLE